MLGSLRYYCSFERTNRLSIQSQQRRGHTCTKSIHGVVLVCCFFSPLFCSLSFFFGRNGIAFRGGRVSQYMWYVCTTMSHLVAKMRGFVEESHQWAHRERCLPEPSSESYSSSKSDEPMIELTSISSSALNFFFVCCTAVKRVYEELVQGSEY